MPIKNHIELLQIIAIVYLTIATATAETTTNAEGKSFENLTILDYRNALNGQQFSHAFFEFLQKENSTENFIETQSLLCLADVTALIRGTTQGDLWALQAIDSWGSIPSGLLMGRRMDLGNFDECIRLNAELSTNHNFRGKYCLATMPFGKLLPIGSYKDFLSFSMAICMPASCKATEIDSVLKQFLQNLLNIKINSSVTLVEERRCSTSEKEPLSGAAIAFIVLLSILAALVVLSTLGDYFLEARAHPVIKALSARANARQLFRVVDYDGNPNVISCLNGIRCLSLSWVLFGHDFLVLIASPNINSIDMLQWADTPFAMFITQGFFSVDTFFFMSGLLLVMVAMREMDKKSGKLNVPLMYLHRYVRLTPCLAFGILATLTLKYLGNGPLWDSFSSAAGMSCYKNWWQTLLYVQNYVCPDEQCLGQAWYLAVDMQLYVISPIFLISLWKWGKKAVLGTFVFLLLMWACLFSTMMINGYTLFYKTLGQSNMVQIYFPTHMRPSPWLIGLMLGYYLHVTKGQRVRLSLWTILIGWIVSFGLIFTCLFSLYPKSQVSAAPLTTLEESLFVSLTRIAWPLGLSWLVFACVQGYGGPINSFLSAPLWQPFARLSYCMYIFHSIIQSLNGGRTRLNTHFSNYDLMLRFWSDFGFTLILSVFMYLLVEAPFTGLEKIFMTPKRRPEVNKSSPSMENILSAEPSNESNQS